MSVQTFKCGRCYSDIGPFDLDTLDRAIGAGDVVPSKWCTLTHRPGACPCQAPTDPDERTVIRDAARDDNRAAFRALGLRSVNQYIPGTRPEAKATPPRTVNGNTNPPRETAPPKAPPPPPVNVGRTVIPLPPRKVETLPPPVALPAPMPRAEGRAAEPTPAPVAPSPSPVVVNVDRDTWDACVAAGSLTPTELRGVIPGSGITLACKVGP